MRVKRVLALSMALAMVGVWTPAITSDAAELTQATSTAGVKYGNLSKSDQELLASMFDYEWYKAHNPDVVAAIGDDRTKLFEHAVKCGIFEGRSLNGGFNVSVYKSAYPDVATAFGDDIMKYYHHYVTLGQKENRTITTLSAAAAAGITVHPIDNPEIALTPAVIKVAEAKGITDTAQAIAAAKPTGSSSSGGSSSSAPASSSSSSTPSSSDSESGSVTPEPTPEHELTPEPTPEHELTPEELAEIKAADKALLESTDFSFVVAATDNQVTAMQKVEAIRDSISGLQLSDWILTGFDDYHMGTPGTVTCRFTNGDTYHINAEGNVTTNNITANYTISDEQSSSEDVGETAAITITVINVVDGTAAETSTVDVDKDAFIAAALDTAGKNALDDNAFGGYFTDPGCTKALSHETKATEATTVYAKFTHTESTEPQVTPEEFNFIVINVVNGTAATSGTNVLVTKDAVIATALNAAGKNVLNDDEFGGYFTDASCTEALGETTATEPKIVYAKFTHTESTEPVDEKVTITVINVVDETAAESSTTVDVDKDAVIADALNTAGKNVLDDNDFVGYFTDPGCTKALGGTTATEAATVYAKFTHTGSTEPQVPPVKVTITVINVVDETAEDSGTTVDVDKDDFISTALNTAGKNHLDGYDFAGYFTDEHCSESLSDETTATEATTVYAMFTHTEPTDQPEP